tara:strand:+ start:45097 stop:46290 length:1194 start_codon:yes stop_codon:yes gene_type:complete
MKSDTDVSIHGSSLQGKRILLAISGGIAATESVKISRELRRHGAIVTAMMTNSAKKIISPLAVSWGSGSEVQGDWRPEMAQLGHFDGVLLAPATRNTIAKHVNGIIDSPVLMALAASMGNSTPVMFVPSMHEDLFDNPVTSELLDSLRQSGIFVLVDDPEEGKRKQPAPVSVVANFSNCINKSLSGRKKVVITLGANRAPIDSVRAIHNTSTGRTGWAMAEHLHRMGHEVICISGHTSTFPSFNLPYVRTEPSPEGMLSATIELAKSTSKPDAWIHCAAILDYIPEFTSGKNPSGDGPWEITLHPGPKHLAELSSHVNGSIQIGFKLEVTASEEKLNDSAMGLIHRYGLDAVVANQLSEAEGESEIRCRIITPDGNSKVIENQTHLCEHIEYTISKD